MEKRTRRKVRELTIENGFECSRLEERLLVQVYERVVPPVVRAAGGLVSDDRQSRSLSDRFQRT